jgi:hypothetical protein
LPPKPRKEVVDVVLRPYASLAKAELAPTPSFVVVCTKRFTNDAGEEEDEEEELEEEETSANNPPTHANATAAVLIVVLFLVFKVVPNIFVASSSFSTSKSSFSSFIKGCRSKSLNLVLLPLYPRLIIVPVAAADDDDKDAFSRPRDIDRSCVLCAI